MVTWLVGEPVGFVQVRISSKPALDKKNLKKRSLLEIGKDVLICIGNLKAGRTGGNYTTCKSSIEFLYPVFRHTVMMKNPKRSKCRENMMNTQHTLSLQENMHWYTSHTHFTSIIWGHTHTHIDTITEEHISWCKTSKLFCGSSLCLDVLLLVRPPVYRAAWALYRTGDMNAHSLSVILCIFIPSNPNTPLLLTAASPPLTPSVGP